MTADVWDGVDRRRPEAFSYSLSEFPLLPTATPLWSEVPTSVVHLDVLLVSLPSALITFDAPGVRAAGVVFQTELHDALWADAQGAVLGRQAWERIVSQPEGIVSAYELDDRLAEALPILWRSHIVVRDLDKRWLHARRFVDNVARAGQDRAVIVATQTRVGIALYLHGDLAGAWTSVSRGPDSAIEDVLDILQEDVEGAVSVIERIADDVAEPFLLSPPTEAPREEPAGDPQLHPEWQTPGEQSAGETPPDTLIAEASDLPMVELEPEASGAGAAASGDEEVAAPPVPEVAVPPAEPAPVSPVPDDPWSRPAAAEATVAAADSPRAESPAFDIPAARTTGFEEIPAAPELLAPAPAERGLAPLFALSEGNSPDPDPAAPAPLPSTDPRFEVDFDSLIAALVTMGEDRLGSGFAEVSHLLTNAERSASGLRRAIRELRQAPLSGRPQEDVSDAGRDMLRYVSDRVTGS